MKLLSALILTSLVFAQFARANEEAEHRPVLFPKKEADASKATRPAVVELLEPKALSKVSGSDVTLKWSEATGAESYHLQVATDPNFKWLVVNEAFVKGTSYDVKGLEAGLHYFWRVYGQRSENDRGWMSSFSNLSSFETSK
ncbi:MAG: fibronectin type III domain-containing protein [Bdellovibrio sp. CG10_big_fil_rev_8_21_14_0_10_47_8]|nr:MAG: fibronectin type III domain-containing protein [Bdellovibrio sp. CG10_big_fil_rev_8_21_14_0_10_47_8]